MSLDEQSASEISSGTARQTSDDGEVPGQRSLASCIENCMALNFIKDWSVENHFSVKVMTQKHNSESGKLRLANWKEARNPHLPKFAASEITDLHEL